MIRFLDKSPKPRAVLAKINKGDYIKLKILLHHTKSLYSKGTLQQGEKKTNRMGEKSLLTRVGRKKKESVRMKVAHLEILSQRGEKKRRIKRSWTEAGNGGHQQARSCTKLGRISKGKSNAERSRDHLKKEWLDIDLI